MNGQGEWQKEQWKGLGKEIEWLEKEMGATRREVVSLAKMVKEEKRDPAAMVEQGETVPRRSEAPAPQLGSPPAPEAEEEDEIEEFSDMEGIQREGLYDSQHVPAAGEPDYMTQASIGGKDKESPQSATQKKRARRQARTEARKEKEKGKGKEVVKEPATGTNTVPIAPRSILKRPETTKWEKAELMKRWREGKFNQEEERVATEAAEEYRENKEGETPEQCTERQEKA
jgi:hypothetical protein